MGDYNSKSNRQKQDRLSLLAQRIENQKAYQQQGLVLREQQMEMTQEEREFQREIAKTQQLKNIMDMQAKAYELQREQQMFMDTVQARAKVMKLNPQSTLFRQQLEELKAQHPLAASDSVFSDELKASVAIHDKSMEAFNEVQRTGGRVPTTKDGIPDWSAYQQLKQMNQAQKVDAVMKGTKGGTLSVNAAGDFTARGDAPATLEDTINAARAKGVISEKDAALLRNKNDFAYAQAAIANASGAKVETAADVKAKAQAARNALAKLGAVGALNRNGMPDPAANKALIDEANAALAAADAAYAQAAGVNEQPVAPVGGTKPPTPPIDPLDEDLNPTEPAK